MNAPFQTDVTIARAQTVGQTPPVLSVLIPFYRDDPSDLLSSLSAQSDERIEVLFYDDGTGDAPLSARFGAAVQDSTQAVTLITAHENRGRSSARNALQHSARADWVLFLDADMRPGSARFLVRYLAAIAEDDADIIFGGFSVPDHADTPDRELHRALSQVSDCLPLSQRIKAGPQFVASSNLCVRKSVLDAEPFDDNFSGWGWEDSEWAARVSARYRLKHIDNSAVHLGLETDVTLLSRFKTSAANYARFTQKHPDLARSLALFRLTQTMARWPAQGLLRPVYHGMVKARFLPMRLRILGLKLWRASWYGTHFKKARTL